MSRILIVEDEEKIARFVELELAHEGYEVDKAADGRSGVEAALERDYDLILLDIMLPELNGLEVLRRIRKVKRTPVILLTARDEVMDKVAGLDGGADDYITKPFAIEELLARIRVTLRHGEMTANGDSSATKAESMGEASSPMPPGAGAVPPVAGSTRMPAVHTASETPLAAGPVRLYPEAHEVRVGGEPVELTVREFDVLRCLMERSDAVQTREQLIRAACGWDYVGDTNVIDVYVSHIRAKIDKRFGIELISAVRGVGYVIRTR